DASWNFDSGNLRSNLQLLSTDEEPVVADPTLGNFPGAPTSATTLDENSDEVIPQRRSTRERKPNPRYPNNVTSCQFALLISNPKYAEDLSEKFHMMNCEAAATPMNNNDKLQGADGTEKMNLSPTKQHLGATKRILCYVSGTENFGIWYSKVSNFVVVIGGCCELLAAKSKP
uniref:Uncharacterized protein n=1 Tax=Solanum lycopersicum TaxID=4081 RepID=A0A3Q7H8V5_SOLLC